MRYDKLRLTERDEALIAYIKSHPDDSQAEIGLIFGIKTRQRVNQILSKYGKRKVDHAHQTVREG